jgi:heat shock protein HslJ
MNRRYSIRIIPILILILPCIVCSGPNRNEDLDMSNINISLTGRLWRLEHYEPEGGGVYIPDSSEIYTLEFSEDLTLIGDYECNACFGNYELGPDSGISLSIVCSDMACDTRPENPLNIYYLPSLYGVDSYEIRGNQLRLHYQYILRKGMLSEGNLLYSDISFRTFPKHD